MANTPKKTFMGRPTTYHPGLIDKVAEYIEACKGENPIDVIPSLVGFAVWSEISLNTLDTWKSRDLQDLDEDKYPRFKDFRRILEHLNSFQCVTVMNKGARREISEKIAALVLGKHGFKSNMDVTTNGESIKPSISIG